MARDVARGAGALRVDRALEVGTLFKREALGNDVRLDRGGGRDGAEARLGQRPDWQLAKYALVSWIDEVMLEAPWDGHAWWNENVLEVEMFNQRLAHEDFYLRARDAGSLPQRDALEVFYVCVVLGFRGLYRDPEIASTMAEPLGLAPDLETWAKQTSLAIRLGRTRALVAGWGALAAAGGLWFALQALIPPVTYGPFPYRVTLATPTGAPRRRGRRRMRKRSTSCGANSRR